MIEIERFEGYYVRSVAHENEFNPDVYHGDTTDMYTAYLEIEKKEALLFWQSFMDYQTEVGPDRAYVCLKQIVHTHGLSMIMDSEFGRKLVGPAKFDRILLTNRYKQTKLFERSFGKAITQGGDYIKAK